MKEIKLVQFLRFLTRDDRLFRKVLLRFPLATALGSFILNWLVLDKGLSKSLSASAFIFLLTCFIGLIGEIMRRGKLR